MDEMIKGVIGFLTDNPSLFTLLLGFVIGFIVGLRKG